MRTLRHAKFLVTTLGLLLTAFVNTNAQTATVTTDKLDYSPGSTVIITGSGYTPGETVALHVSHDPLMESDSTDPAHTPWNVTADANGNINSTWVIDADGPGAHYKLTATGQASALIAYAYFTDAAATYYSVASGDFNTVTNWKTNRDGTGSSPADLKNAGDIFIIQNGHLLTTSADVDMSSTGEILRIEAGGTLTANHLISLKSSGTFEVQNGGTYIHNYNNATVPSSGIFSGTEIFGTTSIFKITNWNTSAITTGVTLPFGNVEIALPGAYSSTWNQTWTGTINLCVGEFKITSLGTGTLRFASNTSTDVTVGSYTQNAGIVDLSNGFSGTPVTTLNVTGNFLQSAGTLSTTGSTATGNINIGGNWTRNGGTFTAGTGTVNFNNTSVDQTIGGTSTTTFNILQVSKGSQVRILEATAQVGMAQGGLTLSSGTFKISNVSTSIRPFFGSPVAIGATAGLWNNGGTILGSSNDVTLAGLFRNTSGLSNFGNGANISFLYSSGATVLMEGGNVDIAGRFSRDANDASTVNYTQSGGTFRVVTVSTSSTTRHPFDIGATGSNFTMSAGSIVITKEGGGGADDLGYLNLAATTNVTGGTLQIGDASIPTPSGQTMQINSTAPVYNLIINSTNSPVAKLLTNNLTVKNDVTIAGGTLDANNLNLTVGGNWSNSGTFTAGAGTVTFNHASATQILNNGSSSFNNLVHNAAGTLQLSTNALSVAGTFTNSAGTFDANGIAATYTGLATISGGEYQAKTATQNFNGGLTVSGGVFTGNTGTVNTSLFTLSSGTLTAPSGQFNLTGNWNHSGGTFNANGGTVNFSKASGSQTINESGTFNNLNHNAAGDIGSSSGAFNVSGTFENSAGTIDIGNYPHTFSGLATISGGIYKFATQPQTFNGGLTVSGGTFEGGNDYVTISDLTINSGIFTAQVATRGYYLIINGNWINNGGTFNHSSNKIYFGGGSQTIGGTNPTTFYNVDIAGTAAKTLTNNITINNLSLQRTINTGANVVTVNGTLAVGNGWINGNLSKLIPPTTPTTSYISFPVGDANTKAELYLKFDGTSPTGNGYLTASTAPIDPTSGLQPSGAGLSATKYVKRRWVITNNGVTGISTYSMLISFVSADKLNGADYTKFVVSKLNGTTWTFPTVGQRANTFTEVTGLSSFSEFAIGEPLCTAPTLSAVGTSPSCNGVSDGSIALTVTGGSSPFTYLWSPGGSTSEDPTGLAAGSYNVTVTANGGCTATLASPVVLTNPVALSATVNSTNVTCNGAANGTITITSPQGGYGTYEYRLNTGAWQSSGSFTGLANGSYSVQIRDAAHTSCVVVLNAALNITQPAILSASVGTNVTTCYGTSTGAIQIVDAAGGSGNYEFSINGTTWQSSPNFTGLASGTYQVSIRDASATSCTKDLDGAGGTFVPTNALMTATITPTDATCFGTNTGEILITNGTGGSGEGNLFSINNGLNWQTGVQFQNLVAGTYQVLMQDPNYSTCIVDLDGNGGTVIGQPAVLAATVTPTNATCFGGNGSIAVTGVSGGAGTYEYSKDNGATWQSTGSFGSLAAGTYQVSIRDAAHTSCVIDLDGTGTVVGQPAVLSATVTPANANCYSTSTGSITVSAAAGGSGQYEYTINGGTSWQASGSYTGLANGTYQVSIRDKQHTDCVKDLDGLSGTVLTQPAILAATVGSANVTCNGANDGTITISSPTGGGGTYEYRLNSDSWQPGGSFTGLANGSYSVQIRDAAQTSCVVVLNASLGITQPAVLNATVGSANVTCNGANDGTITVSSPTGGYGTYEYRLNSGSWQSNGNFTITLPQGGYGTYQYRLNSGSWQSSGSFTALANGSYSVQIRDAAHTSCVVVLNAALNITQPDLVNAPTGDATQAFFGPSTVANLTAVGTNIKWYLTLAGTSSLDPTTGLIMGHHYFATQTINGCESPSRLEVVAVVTDQIITAINKGVFCAGDNMIIDFKTTGEYLPTNVFTVEITNGGGQFGGNPTILTTVGSVSNLGPSTQDGIDYNLYQITVKIPIISTGGGTYDHYRIRVIASKGDNGTVNGTKVTGSTYFYNVNGFTINPSPEIYTVTGGGDYCASGSGVPVGLSNSQNNVNYTLYRYVGADSTELNTVAGTSSAISFGNQIPGLYKVKGVFSGTGGCGMMMSGSATVTANSITAGTIAGNQTICSGDDPAAFTETTPASGSSTLTYQWQYFNGTSWVDINGATNTTYDVPSGLTATTRYHRIATSTLNAAVCSATSNEVTVTVNHVNGGVIGAAQTICEGDDVAAFTSATDATGDGVLTYQWQKSTTSGSTGFANIDGATSSTYNEGTITQDTWYKRLATSTLNGKACTEESNVIRVTVNNFETGSIGTAQTICEGDDVAAFNSVADASGDGTTITYQWQKSTTSGSAGFANIGGAQSSTYNEGTIIQDTWYKRLATSTLNGKACTEESNVIKVTVNNFDPGSIGLNVTICEGDDPAAFTSVASSGDGAITYQWQVSTTNGTTGFTDIVGAQSATYDAGALTQDTWYKRLATSTLYGTACTEESNVVAVTVNNMVPGSIGSDVTICEGDDPAAFTSVAAIGDGTVTYQWQISTNGTSFTDIVGAQSATYDAGALAKDTWYKRLATSTLNSKACTEESNIIKVTVNNVNGGAITADQTICSGSTPAGFGSTTPGTGDGAITYRWEKSVSPFSTWTAAGGTGATFTSGTLTEDTKFRRVTISTTASPVVACEALSNEITITVNNVTGGSIGSDQIISSCDDPAAFTQVTASTADGPITYRWEKSIVDGTTGFSTIPSATGYTYDPPSGLTQTTYYRRVTISTLSGGTCEALSNSIKVVVTYATVTVTPNPRQYSDKVTFEATLSPADIPGLTAPTNVDFYVGTQKVGSATLSLISGVLKATLPDVALLEPSPFGTAPTGQMAPGAHTVTADFTNEGAGFPVCNPTTTLNIIQEDARVFYTGALAASTSSINSYSATVILSATIKDITAAIGDAAYDASAGDIRNAKVRFFDRSNNATLADNVSVGLVSLGDTKIGTATANVTLTVPSNPGYATYTIGIEVKNYYTRNSTEDDAVVNVALPMNDFITGGGYLILNSSSGQKAGDLNSRNNFGFNVKYNKSNTNLQGNINTIIRRTELNTITGLNEVRVYQIKGNSMTSLSAQGATANSPGKATFNGKASIQDITNPAAVGSVDGNATLQVTMTDNGEPGTYDRIAITVWNKSGGLWFASNWNNTRTLEQQLAKGNLQVRSSTSTITGTVQSTVQLVSSGSPSNVGATVTFTATVIGSGTQKPTGTVNFYDYTTNTLLGNVPLNSTTGIATYPTSALTAGSHEIVAYYGGDNRYSGSASSLIQVVGASSKTMYVETKGSTPIPAPVDQTSILIKGITIAEALAVKVMPNPSTDHFNLVISGGSQHPVSFRVTDITGKIVEIRSNQSGETVQLGSTYKPGVYIVEVIQGKTRKQLKLVKL